MCMKIRHFKQEEKKECWFACAMMVLDYYGKAEGKEYSELREEYGSQECSDPTNLDKETNYLKLMKEYGGNSSYIQMVLEKKGIEVFPHYFIEGKKEKLHGLIKKEIASGRPVILGLNKGKDGGHYVVVYGIQGEDYLILDPLGSKNSRIKISSKEIAEAILTVPTKKKEDC